MALPGSHDPDLLSARPSPAAGLETYAAEIQELVLYLRDEGHVLSPIDQHLVESWWQSGFPLDVVLRTVWKQGHLLRARKKPPRGLPLRSMNRQVERAGLAALRSRVGRSDHEARGDEAAVGAGARSGSGETPDQELQQAQEAVGRLSAEVQARLEGLGGSVASDGALEASLGRLEVLAGQGLAAHPLLCALLHLGRGYYDALWFGLTASEQKILRSDVLDDLGGSVARMSPDALEETILELCRRRLRAQDPLFDPQRYWRME